MNKSSLFVICAGVALAWMAFPLLQTNAETSVESTERQAFSGTYHVNTNAPTNSQIIIANPTVVAIGGEPFLKGELRESSGIEQYVAIRTIVQMVALKPSNEADSSDR